MSAKRAHVLVVVVLALGLATTVYWVLMTRSRNQPIEKYRRAYAEIKLGDSRDAVVTAMGEPHEVTSCPYTPFADAKREVEFRSKCFQEYECVELMARYTISFDGNGTVIHKSKAVSP